MNDTKPQYFRFSIRIRLFGIASLLLLAVLVLLLFRAPSVDVVQPTMGTAIRAVYATGTVEAAIMMPIAARVMARLKKLNSDEGNDVVKDSILAELESEDMQSSLASARAKEAFARADFERHDELLSKKAISRQAYERSKSDWEIAKAAVAEAQAQSGFLNLVAPADGHIIRRDGEIGQLIPANQPVFWISVASPLRISAEVDEEDITLVKVDQVVVVSADAFPGQVFKAKVKSITPKGDPIARSFRVRIEFTENTPLQIGMTAETNIIISEKSDALLIPSSAVINGQVLRVVDSKLVPSAVKLGTSGSEKIEVIEGLGLQDVIVLAPDKKLKSGTRVRTNLIEQGR